MKKLIFTFLLVLSFTPPISAQTVTRSNSSIVSPTFTGQSKFPDGTVALPSVSFTADTNTGVYRIGTDNLGIATNGVLRFDVSTTAITSALPIILPDSTGNDNVTLGFSGGTTTGIYGEPAGAGGVFIKSSAVPVLWMNGAPNLRWRSDAGLGWAADSTITTTADLEFRRLAAGSLIVRQDSTHGAAMNVATDGTIAFQSRAGADTAIVTANQFVASGAVAIGNTVGVAAAVASTHKVTMVIGGVTYYLLATNVP